MSFLDQKVYDSDANRRCRGPINDKLALQSLLRVIANRPNPYNKICCPRCGNSSPQSMAVCSPTDPKHPPAIICTGNDCAGEVIATVECRGSSDPKLRRLAPDDVADLEPGDEIVIHRGLFVCGHMPGSFHHSIIGNVHAEENKIDGFNFNRPDGCCVNIPASVSEFKGRDIFQFNADTYIVDYIECYPTEYVLERAKSRTSAEAQKYNRFCVFTNNCEMYARWAKTGRPESDQTQECLETTCLSTVGFLFRLLTTGMLLLVQGIVPVDPGTGQRVWQSREAWVSLAFSVFWMLIIAVYVIRSRCRERVGTLLEYSDTRTCCRRLRRRDCCAVNCGLFAGIVTELFLAWFAPMIAVAIIQFLVPDQPYLIIMLFGVLAIGDVIGYILGFGIGRQVEQLFDCCCRRQCCLGRRKIDEHFIKRQQQQPHQTAGGKLYPELRPQLQTRGERLVSRIVVGMD